MANGIEQLARRMLKAAYRRRITGFDVPDVLDPRDTEVVRDLRYNGDNAPELWEAEEFLEDGVYIVPAPISPGGQPMVGLYTITSRGMSFMGED